jgi:pilus assembly protein CpaD
MKNSHHNDAQAGRHSGCRLAKALAISLIALAATGCKHLEENSKVAGWTLIDASQRHPILVSQKPSNLNLRVARGSHGLSPQQRADLLHFASSYRASDAGNSRLIISAPSGAANEVSSMAAVDEIRHMLSENGFSESVIAVEAYHADSDPQPPIRVSYLRYVAEAPQCGEWPGNLASEAQNLPYHNLGCATQRNFAAMVANPADLLGPRSETPRSGERRGEGWEKYVKGDTTGAKKSEDEKVQVKNQN